MSFVIDTEIAPAYFNNLMKFIYKYYILRLRERFTNVKRKVVDNEYRLSFRALGPEGKWYTDVEIRLGNPIQVKMFPSDEKFPSEALDRLKDDLFITVQFFEEKIRKTTLYFAWVEGEEIIPEKVTQRHSIIYRLFSESMLFFFVIFIAASIFVFIIFGLYAPIILVTIQFLMVLFADRIIMRTGDWRITQKNPSVHLLQYHLPFEEREGLQQKLTTDLLIKMKTEIHERTFAVKKTLDLKTCEEVLSKYGFKCKPENMSTKIVNVYEIVKKVADRFKLVVPKIVIANTMLPNAAASGPSPSHGVMVITTGLLVQLEDDEIVSVVGHEFGHFKGRDPLALFGLTATEFLLRVYVFWPFLALLGDFSLFFGYLYLFIALSAVYFIAKFFESRADLESAIKIGQPKVLAEALRKIGFRRLQFERIPAYKFQEWIQWDPHPPIYFRVSRLDELQDPDKIKHPLIQSIKDNIRGFLSVLG